MDTVFTLIVECLKLLLRFFFWALTLFEMWLIEKNHQNSIVTIFQKKTALQISAYLACIFKRKEITFSFLFYFLACSPMVCGFNIRYYFWTTGILFISILKLYLFGNCSEVSLTAWQGLLPWKTFVMLYKYIPRSWVAMYFLDIDAKRKMTELFF